LAVADPKALQHIMTPLGTFPKRADALAVGLIQERHRLRPRLSGNCHHCTIISEIMSQAMIIVVKERFMNEAFTAPFGKSFLHTSKLCL